MKKLKVFFTAFGAVGIAFMMYAFTTNTLTSNSIETKTEWENLEVLPQDISKDSLIGLMKSYSKSLGVKCDYCHKPRANRPDKLDFPSDDKMTKLIARGMIKMTNDINENYFKPHYPDPKPESVNDVNCLTCHRGNPNPKKYLEGVGSLYHKEKTDKEKP